MSLLTWTLGGLVVAFCATGVAEIGSTDLALTTSLGALGILALLRIRAETQAKRADDVTQPASPEFGTVQTIKAHAISLGSCSPDSHDSKERP